jgi:thymidylate synthase (FAD)
MSARYSILPNEFYIPELDRIQLQSKDNKQGSGDQMAGPDADTFRRDIEVHSKLSYQLYEDMIEAGLARELARMVLPTNIYTQWFWKMDLHNLMHFLKLRLHPHAQYEIRVFGEAIADMVKEHCPVAWEAFEDYALNAENMSAQEMGIVKELARDGFSDDMVLNLGKREKTELLGKLQVDG